MENDHVGRILCRQQKRQPSRPFSELRVPVGPQLVREDVCGIAKHCVYARGEPSCFFSDCSGDKEKGLELQSDMPFCSGVAKDCG